MSHFADYLREKTTDQIIETKDGFATYRYLPDKTTVYLIDLYIVPARRQQGVAANLANLIVKEAKSNGCKVMLGSVVPTNKGSNDSLKVLLAYGMTLDHLENNLIVFRKDI